MLLYAILSTLRQTPNPLASTKSYAPYTRTFAIRETFQRSIYLFRTKFLSCLETVDRIDDQHVHQYVPTSDAFDEIVKAVQFHHETNPFCQKKNFVETFFYSSFITKRFPFIKRNLVQNSSYCSSSSPLDFTAYDFELTAFCRCPQCRQLKREPICPICKKLPTAERTNVNNNRFTSRCRHYDQGHLVATLMEKEIVRRKRAEMLEKIEQIGLMERVSIDYVVDKLMSELSPLSAPTTAALSQTVKLLIKFYSRDPESCRFPIKACDSETGDEEFPAFLDGFQDGYLTQFSYLSDPKFFRFAIEACKSEIGHEQFAEFLKCLRERYLNCLLEGYLDMTQENYLDRRREGYVNGFESGCMTGFENKYVNGFENNHVNSFQYLYEHFLQEENLNSLWKDCPDLLLEEVHHKYIDGIFAALQIHEERQNRWTCNKLRVDAMDFNLWFHKIGNWTYCLQVYCRAQYGEIDPSQFDAYMRFNSWI